MSANEKKFKLYTEQLTNWAKSEHTHPKLTPVLRYVKGGTILSDLLRCGLVKVNEKGEPENEKMLVRWRVLGEEPEACWLDGSLFDAFTEYYLSTQNGPAGLCMVTGVEAAAAGQHPKGIVAINGNAKLISANDSSGFTYRGRFTEESQALTVSYEASQKAHNALRWLVDNQGVRAIFGGRTFLCWNPQGKKVILPHLPFMPPPKPIFKPSDYRDELQKALNGQKAELNLTDGVVLAAFDAATTGRLSVTYYNELMGHDFLQRLHDWDVSCCWPHRCWGICSPKLSQIVHYAYGTQRMEKGHVKMVAEERILVQQMQRLISCRVDKAPIDVDILKSLVERASNLDIYKTHEDPKEDIRENLLFITCAVIRKFRMNRFKEEWEMSLEPCKMDRSYQFGRLMAVFEQIERAVSYKTGQEHRTSYTIRYQKAFCNKPFTATENIHTHLRDAYLPRLSMGRQVYYQNLIGEIMEILSRFSAVELNAKLSETYLLGYYLQRSEMMQKGKRQDEQEEEA